MAVGNNGNMKVPTTYVTWSETSITVQVGGAVTVTYTGTDQPLVQSNVEGFLGGIATADTATANSVTFTGVSAGTATIPYNSLVGQSIYTASVLEITVTAAADDEEYLNKRGLTHFWSNIDTLKQDKLTAGTNITIAADNTISASQPTVGNATLTIQKNGTNVQTFTANATSNKTANITVPTKTSDITNDSGFVSTSDVGTVTGTMMVDATVGSDKLTPNAVWTANIKDAAVTSAKIDWSTMAFGNYSTSEQDTNLTWINGAKIYKKTIVSTDLVAGENNINHNISNLGLVLKYDGLIDLGGGVTLPIPTMASVTNNSASVWIVNSTIIRIFSSLPFTGTVYITLYYTKTS